MNDEERIRQMLDEGAQWTFDNFAKHSARGYVASPLPTWVAWTTRAEEIVNRVCGPDSAAAQTIQDGRAMPIVGNGSDKFERARSFFMGALQVALDTAQRTPSPQKPDSQTTNNLERFGEWLLTGRQLGRGGQGEVVHVRHAQTFERGALKRMVGKRALTDKGRERFLREIEAFKRIEHPFVIRVLDAGESPEPYLVTELAAFGTLHDSRSAFRGDAWRVLRLARCIALGLAAAHAEKIVHRDIKPKNILLQSLDHPLVADFGIAHFDDKDTVTSVGSHPGAFKFAPPEYEYDEEPTPAFDVFSLGAALHFAMTGDEQKRPYRLLEPLPPVGGSGGAAERLRAVDDLIAKMTKRNHSDRFQSMNEVVDAVDAVTERLFGRVGRGSNACVCETGSFRDIGTVLFGRGTEIFIKPDGQVEEFRLSQVSPRVEMCPSCGTLRLRAAQHPPREA